MPARKDAIEQFKSQGVDLSNIVTESQADQPHAVVNAVLNLEKLLENEEALECLMDELKVIEDECKIDLPRRILAEKNGAFNKFFSV